MLSSVHSKHGAGRYLTQRWGSLHFALPPLDLKCDQHLKCDKHLKCDQNKPNLDRPIVFHFQVTQAKPTQGSYSQEELSPPLPKGKCQPGCCREGFGPRCASRISLELRHFC